MAEKTDIFDFELTASRMARIARMYTGVSLAMSSRRCWCWALSPASLSPSRAVRMPAHLLARGLVLALVGIGVVDAAISYNSAKSGGIDKALLTLHSQPVGPVLLVLVALGLVIFGIYGLCEARWRRVRPMSTVAVVAHARKSFGGGLGGLREALGQKASEIRSGVR